MKFFCDMVTATQGNHMWPPRRDFWLQLYADKMIDEAWVAFGAEARVYAERNLLGSNKANMNRRFGRQHDRGGSTSLLIMRIGNKIVVDGCHSYKTHIFRSDDKNAPKLYQQRYYCDDIMRASRNSKPHNSIPVWKQWVLQNV
ncbi:EH signature domain-containing protein [uncultured Cohaesibacter sp.]|uniref:EH signature domain-containing protein n=1 Tax=uncultured Cohaesibacter sp. TaxID=1002546 RepID=UPI0029C8CA97|nr:EH signature domain-containing protein [uncultured Cohaesibacter sp.]